ncbi:MAG: FmdB family transcriptional regulator [Chloroflexi bacterium]|nr:FmdB family transcriptional regulator [Chloroflexota bacterium]
MGNPTQEFPVPRYDYRCESCKTEFELVQSFAEAGSGTCPECSGNGQRVYHAVPVIYKGSGFYTTDYGRPKPPVESKTEPAKASTSSSSDSSSDSKSDLAGTSSSETTAAKSTTDSGSSSSTTPASST